MTLRFLLALGIGASLTLFAPSSARSQSCQTCESLKGVYGDRTNIVFASTGHVSTDSGSGRIFKGGIIRQFKSNTAGLFEVSHFSLPDVSSEYGATLPARHRTSELRLRSEFLWQIAKPVTVQAIGLFRKTDHSEAYMLWTRATVTIFQPVSLIFGMRPAHDDVSYNWSNAVELGIAANLPGNQSLKVRMIQTSRRDLEPPVTFLAAYENSFFRTLTLRANAAQSGDDEFYFREVQGGLTWIIQSRLGLKLDLSKRTGTLAEERAGLGLMLGL